MYFTNSIIQKSHRWPWWLHLCKRKGWDPWMKAWQGNNPKSIRRRQKAFMYFAVWIRKGRFHNKEIKSINTITRALNECAIIMINNDLADPRRSVMGNKSNDLPLQRLLSFYKQQDNMKKYTAKRQEAA